ncbi:hypothetical protein BDF22DRAFT_692497 [Syncephalis plumigaleata]|nr:hypothetical protein BDF22DRAFT_692497 [Syncephalis plumigaleata]
MSHRRKQAQTLSSSSNAVTTTIIVATAVVALGVYLYRRLGGYGGGGDEGNDGDRTRLGGGRHGNNNLLARTNQDARRSGKAGKTIRRAMTISLRNVILWNPSPDPSTPTLGFVQHAVNLLKYFAINYDLYLIMPVTTIEEKEEVLRMLRQAGLMAPSASSASASSTNLQQSDVCLDEHKVMFCETTEGVAHIVRHLTPAIHVDADLDTVQLVRTFVGRVVWVRAPRPVTVSSNGGEQSSAAASAASAEVPHLWPGRGAPVETVNTLSECSLVSSHSTGH